MNKPIFKVRLEVSGRTVLFQVLEQAESLERGDIGKKKIYYTLGNYRIISSMCPMLTDEDLYLRGYIIENDKDFCIKNFTSKEEAIEYYNKMKELIKSFQEDRKNSNTESNIFEVY